MDVLRIELLPGHVVLACMLFVWWTMYKKGNRFQCFLWNWFSLYFKSSVVAVRATIWRSFSTVCGLSSACSDNHAIWRSTKVFPLPVPIHMCHIPYTFMVGCVLLSLSELSEALLLKLTPRSIISVDQKKEETPASCGSKHEWRVSLPAG